MSRYVEIHMTPEGRKRPIRRRLEVISDQMAGTTRIITGRRVNPEGELVNYKEGVDNIDAYVGVSKVFELTFDWRYGNLVRQGTATQETNPELFAK